MEAKQQAKQQLAGFQQAFPWMETPVYIDLIKVEDVTYYELGPYPRVRVSIDYTLCRVCWIHRRDKFAERSLRLSVFNPQFKSNRYEREKNVATQCLAALRPPHHLLRRPAGRRPPPAPHRRPPKQLPHAPTFFLPGSFHTPPLDPHQPPPSPPSSGASPGHPPTPGADPDDPRAPGTRRPHPSTSSPRRAAAPPKSASRRWIQAGNRPSAPPGGGSGPATIPLLPHDWFPLLCVKIDGVQHVEAGRRDAVVADLLQRLLFDSEITGDEHNQMRTCVHVACALLLAITAVRVHRADYVSGHPQGSVLGIGGDHECEAEVCELRVEACVEQDVPALGILVHVVESTCHVQRDLDMLAPSEHLVAVEPLAKRAVLGELEHHVRQYM
nr:uncharacterized protein LOC109771459 [Aegilops tauschii subsp. strangulata]